MSWTHVTITVPFLLNSVLLPVVFADFLHPDSFAEVDVHSLDDFPDVPKREFMARDDE